LADIPEMGGFPKGSGMEDFGNFSEGFCFKLNTIFPQPEIYVVCCQDAVNINYKFLSLKIIKSSNKTLY